jgi:hypothetical protein
MTVVRALAIPFVVGIALFFPLSSQPHFTDAADWPCVNDLDSPAFYEARESNRTLEGQLADFGLGLAALVFCLAATAVALRADDGAGIRRLSTPSRKWVIVILANVSLLALFYGEWLALVRDQVRGEFPPWADTMAIPMAWLISGWTLLAPILTLALLVCLWNARLPAALWRSPESWWPWITTLVIGSAIGITILALTDAVRYGKAFAIPGYVTLMYGLLCARAAAASRAAVPG